MQQVVTLVSLEVPKSGNGEHGPWSLYVFKDTGNVKYQTFNDDLANVGRGLLNQPVALTFEQETNTRTINGEPKTFTNNKITSIEAAHGAQPQLPTPQPQVQQQAAQQQVQPQPIVPQVVTHTDEKQTVINRSAALARAIETVAAGIATVTSVQQLFAIADSYLPYIERGSQG